MRALVLAMVLSFLGAMQGQAQVEPEATAGTDAVAANAEDDVPGPNGTASPNAEDDVPGPNGTDAVAANEAIAEPNAPAGNPPDAALAQAVSPAPSTGAPVGEDSLAASLGQAIPHIAVLAVALEPEDAAIADGMSEVLIGAVAVLAAEQGRVAILGKEELQAQLMQGEARTLDCVTSDSCLSRVGLQLRVREAVVALLRRQEAGWLFGLDRIDVRTGSLIARAYREVDGSLRALAEALREATEEVFRPSQPMSRLRVSTNVVGAEVFLNERRIGTYAGAPIEVQALMPGEHRLRVHAPGHRLYEDVFVVGEDEELRVEASLVETPGPSISPVLIAGAAGAALGLGVGIGFGVASAREADEGLSRAEVLEEADRQERQAGIATAGWVLFGAGVITSAVGLFLSDFSGEDDDPEVVVSPLPGGLALGLRGQWGAQ